MITIGRRSFPSFIVIYAPGFYTGYAALPLPDLRQAIEDGRRDDASEAANRIIEAIKRATEVLKQGRT